MSSRVSSYLDLGRRVSSPTANDVHTMNMLDRGFLSPKQFKRRLAAVIRTSRGARVPMLKLIHGYGSAARIRSLRHTIRTHLEWSKSHGDIKLYVPGERWGPHDQCSLELIQQVPESIADIDFGRQNKGITLILL